MKKVLILAFDFPPYISVGNLRQHDWFKNLSQFGIDPGVSKIKRYNSLK